MARSRQRTIRRSRSSTRSLLGATDLRTRVVDVGEEGAVEVVTGGRKNESAMSPHSVNLGVLGLWDLGLTLGVGEDMDVAAVEEGVGEATQQLGHVSDFRIHAWERLVLVPVTRRLLVSYEYAPFCQKYSLGALMVACGWQ